MAGSKSDYLEKAILDYLLGAVALAVPPSTGTPVYVALSLAAYSDAATGSAMTEVTGNAYARVAVPNNPTNWTAASGVSPALKVNGGAITFTAATGNWGNGSQPVLSFYIVDALSAGNVLYGGDLGTSKLIGSGDTATFAAGSIQITED
jgi:hypothetical protein